MKILKGLRTPLFFVYSKKFETYITEVSRYNNASQSTIKWSIDHGSIDMEKIVDYNHPVHGWFAQYCRLNSGSYRDVSVKERRLAEIAAKRDGVRQASTLEIARHIASFEHETVKEAFKRCLRTRRL